MSNSKNPNKLYSLVLLTTPWIIWLVVTVVSQMTGWRYTHETTVYVLMGIPFILACLVHWIWGRKLLSKEQKRERAGHCPNCDYDLRGELSSGCPECGWKR